MPRSSGSSRSRPPTRTRTSASSRRPTWRSAPTTCTSRSTRTWRSATASRPSGSALSPAARRALVGAAEERGGGPGEDLQVDPRRAVLDVPDVQFDPLLPGQRGAPVDLRPAGQPGLDLEPAALARRVALDLVGERRP